MSFATISSPTTADYLSAMRRRHTGGAGGNINDIPIYKGRPRRVGRGGRKRRRTKKGGFAPAIISGLARVASVLRSPAVRKTLSTIGSTGAKTAATVGTHYGFQEMARKLRGKGRGRKRRRRGGGGGGGKRGVQVGGRRRKRARGRKQIKRAGRVKKRT